MKFFVRPDLLLRLFVSARFLIALAGCEQHYSPYKYKLTIKLLHNGIIYSGNSVVESDPYETTTLESQGFEENRKGQATLINIGNNQYVAALLVGGISWGGTVTRILQRAYGISSTEPRSSLMRLLSQKRGPRNLGAKDLPTMIWFDDVSDPQSAHLINLADTEKSDSNGLSLSEATIEVSDDAITSGITNVMPWLKIKDLDLGNVIPCTTNDCLQTVYLASGIS